MGVPSGGSGSIAVATGPNYVSSDQLKAYLMGTNANSVSDDLVGFACSAASRAVDAHCDRRFWLDDTATARTFQPRRFDWIDVDDIGDLTGLAITIDSAGNGTYTDAWTTGDYQLWPYNAPYASPEAEPWTRILGVNRSFPYLTSLSSYRLNRVQVTARWGWPAVPSLVFQATLIKAARIYHRRNSPQGVAAFDEFGPVRISRAEDGDVVSMLEDYCKEGVLIA